MHRAMAIIERELRKFFRSPALMLTSMILPMVQLLVLGNAFGGKIHNARVAVVDYDHGPQATRIHEAMLAVQNNARTYTVQDYGNDMDAVRDLKNGKVNGVVVIPAQFSRKYYEKTRPQIGLVVDNTDAFVTAALQQNLADMVRDFNEPQVVGRLPQAIALQTVEIYPYIEYIKYLLPGAITLAIFVAVMIGGGIVYIDDKARGVHEGYLVTPITKLELVTGLNVAGAIKAMMSGVVLTFIGSFLAGVGSAFSPLRLLWLLILIVFTAFAFISMMSFMMARVDDPLIPRAVFGILNTLLYFPSGAIYPIEAFPKWLRVIAYVDPFSYAVHGFKQLLLKDAGISAVYPDFLYLGIFCVVTFTGTVLLFKRTL